MKSRTRTSKESWMPVSGKCEALILVPLLTKAMEDLSVLIRCCASTICTPAEYRSNCSENLVRTHPDRQTRGARTFLQVSQGCPLEHVFRKIRQRIQAPILRTSCTSCLRVASNRARECRDLVPFKRPCPVSRRKVVWLIPDADCAKASPALCIGWKLSVIYVSSPHG